MATAICHHQPYQGSETVRGSMNASRSAQPQKPVKNSRKLNVKLPEIKYFKSRGTQTRGSSMESMQLPAIQRSNTRNSMDGSAPCRFSKNVKRMIPNREATLAQSRAFVVMMRTKQNGSNVFEDKSAHDDYSSIFMEDFGRDSRIASVDNVYAAQKFENQSKDASVSTTKPRFGVCYMRAKEVKRLQDANGKQLLGQELATEGKGSLYKQDYHKFAYGRPFIQPHPRDSQVIDGNAGRPAAPLNSFRSDFYRDDREGLFANMYHRNHDDAMQNMMKNSNPSDVQTWRGGNGCRANLVSLFHNDFMAPPADFKALPRLREPRGPYDPITQISKAAGQRIDLGESEAMRTFRPTESDLTPIWAQKSEVRGRARDNHSTHFTMGNDSRQYDTEHGSEFLEFQEVPKMN